MKRSEVNKCPERAKARAKSDARCALRKLDLLDEIEDWYTNSKATSIEEYRRQACLILSRLAEELR